MSSKIGLVSAPKFVDPVRRACLYYPEWLSSDNQAYRVTREALVRYGQGQQESTGSIPYRCNYSGPHDFGAFGVCRAKSGRVYPGRKR